MKKTIKELETIAKDTSKSISERMIILGKEPDKFPDDISYRFMVGAYIEGLALELNNTRG